MTVLSVSNPPVSIARGTAFRSAFKVANIGTRVARRSTVRVYLSRDRRKSKGDVPLSPVRSVLGLRPGGRIGRTGLIRVPRAISGGRWFLIVCADATGIVRETNERNNCRGSARRIALTEPQPAGAPTLAPVDGGPSYYGRFANALPSVSSYFPIGVWFESVTSQGDIDQDRNAGLNTYVVLTGNTSLSLLRDNGMKTFLQYGEWGSSTAPGAESAGWVLEDEIDMLMSPEAGFAELQRIRGALPADGRVRWNNYGKGVMFWLSDADAAQFVNGFQDIVSTDVYWFTDDNVCGEGEGGVLFNGSTRRLTDTECHRASNYGTQVSRVRGLVSPAGSKPVWAFVELGHPFSEDSWPSITPAQVRAAVWHSLIAGARGITYFNHSFGGPCHTQHILRDACYADVRAMVKSVNGQIRSLAPVLNAPFLSSGFTTSITTKAMAKWQGGHFYVFAGSADNVSSTGSFSIPCVGNAKATVLGESRSIPVSRGSFSDSFADGNAVHIYRIDGGSSCGLS